MMLKSKVALITGGSSGIGMAIAERFLKEGAKIMIAGRSKERCDAVQKQFEIFGADAVDSVAGDVSRWDDVQKMVKKTVDRFGRIDILVNNAGIYLEKRVEETTEDEWDQIININLKGVFLCSKAVYPHFKKQGGGTIVNMSSDSGVSGNPDEAAYCASKGGVTNLTRAMALDYAKENIRVNAICPAVINTPMLQREIDMQEDKEAYLKEMDELHPIGRVGLPKEVAFAVLMVASDEASFITGANISVDGGLTAV
ncbi:MAG: glucose 1-dehydrogenase [Desulfobacterales bacterium]|nr:glucose 1-dehydrogenase [Desulfobacterales bacterium]